ncbi:MULTISPECIES: restriction endonuclease subunit S [Acinetobacter]|uniref:restriction endonuclease subunit S n=1 Tax=Acinetobacter TaxID=469 RepID=UPI00044C6DDD|nr:MULTISPECIES: restriction endonuclease subunit S [Acinetobacter]EXD31191.1 type I restriction modification DNA specificity domain protein [Acinetobacter sp. 479375]
MSLEYQKLGDVADFIRGITYKPNDLVDNFSEGSIVCMRTANVQVQLKQDDLLSVPANLVKNKDKFLIEGDILVSTANSWNLVGKCCWIPKLEYSATAGGFISILRANQEKLDQRYLYHWFNSPNTQLLARNCGRQTTNISNMDLDRCLSIKIPLPPLAEQRRIASILDQADELRQKRQQAIEKLDQLLQAEFISKFHQKNFPAFNVSDLLENEKSMRTGPFGSQLLHSEFVDEGIHVLGIDNAVQNSFNWAKPRFITEEKYKDLKRYTVKPRDVIITIMGTCGKCAVVPEDIPTAINTKHLCCITLDQRKCNPEFLHSYFLLHPTARNYLESRAKGAIMSGLNMGIIKELPVELPPIEMQNEFSKLKQKVILQKTLMIEELSKLNELFQSLQNQAFSGTL